MHPSLDHVRAAVSCLGSMNLHTRTGAMAGILCRMCLQSWASRKVMRLRRPLVAGRMACTGCSVRCNLCFTAYATDLHSNAKHEPQMSFMHMSLLAHGAALSLYCPEFAAVIILTNCMHGTRDYQRSPSWRSMRTWLQECSHSWDS
jgi:hypothetical protein